MIIGPAIALPTAGKGLKQTGAVTELAADRPIPHHHGSDAPGNIDADVVDKGTHKA